MGASIKLARTVCRHRSRLVLTLCDDCLTVVAVCADDTMDDEEDEKESDMIVSQVSERAREQ